MGRILSPLLSALLVSMGAQAQTPAPPTVQRVGTATLENVPEISAQVSADVQRYQNFRAATFQGWLVDGSILIATRFGATQQIHRVTAPGGARTQLTFYPEPVSRAVAIPGTTRFVLASDTGGDEWFQFYLAQGRGEPVQFTEPNTRNLSPTFSKDGTLLAWSRALKGSSEYTLLVADPAHPSRARPAHRENGEIQPSDISEDRARLVFTRNISSRESKILVLDLASGRVTEVAAGTPALYVAPRFAPDGRSLYVISDRDSDVMRLLQIDIAQRPTDRLTPDLKWDVEGYRVSPDGRVLATR